MGAWSAAIPVACMAAAGGAQEVLFDFEAGAEGWWGNPWGGGECEVSAAPEGRFGLGALQCTYRDVEKGANAVSPFLPEDAPWRARQWSGISLWLRGDGSPGRVHIALETSQEGSTGFSLDPPLEEAAWHRLDLPFSTFWSREGLTADPARLRRIIIGCTGTHEFLIDQIALEPAGRRALATPDPSVRPGPFNARLGAPSVTLLREGGLAWRLDLSPIADQGAVTVHAEAQVGDRRAASEPVTLAPEALRSGEVGVWVPLAVQADAEAQTQLSLTGADGARLAAWGYSLPVFSPESPLTRPPIAIYPVPKEVRRLDGVLPLKGGLRVCALGPAEEDLDRATDPLAETAAAYGLPLAMDEGRVNLARANVVLALPGEARGLLPDPVLGRAGDLGNEGYVLRVTPERAVIVAKTGAGLYYGVQSLVAAIDDETRDPTAPTAPCCEVVDWPDFPFRGATVCNPTSRWGYPNDPLVPVGTLMQFVDRAMARQKLNRMVFIISEGMQFDSHPELRSPGAWTKEELRELVQFCGERYIEVIPLVTVLGHANWFCIPHPELREPGHDENIACVRLPETNRLITEVLDEVLEVFQPRTVHIGMDECWWQTLSLPEEQRCPRCKSDWADVVADQAIVFHDHLKQRGIGTMMWGDMLLPEHNGGAPYHTSRALERLPRDIQIANWSWSLARDSNKRFRDLGFTVVRSNSLGVPRDDRPYVSGNMQGLWAKMPWLTDTYYRGSEGFSYLTLLQASEFAWNTDPRLGGRDLDAGMLDERADSVLRRIALQPAPQASAVQTEIDLAAVADFVADGSGDPAVDLSALPTGEVTVARIRFRVPADRRIVALAKPGGEVRIPLNQRAASLHMLVACHVAQEDREAFLKRFRDPTLSQGVPVGALQMRLGNGDPSTELLGYALNVLPWDRNEVPPYVFGSPGVLLSPPGATPPARAYVLQWVNPQPGQPVEEIHFMRADTEAVPMILAATAIGAR